MEGSLAELPLESTAQPRRTEITPVSGKQSSKDPRTCIWGFGHARSFTDQSHDKLLGMIAKVCRGQELMTYWLLSWLVSVDRT
jgi:hypothetical protein